MWGPARIRRCAKELKGKCPDSLNKYAECMDYRSNNFAKCRTEQAAFEVRLFSTYI